MTKKPKRKLLLVNSFNILNNIFQRGPSVFWLFLLNFQPKKNMNQDSNLIHVFRYFFRKKEGLKLQCAHNF
jgi:hypothetical protein